MAFSDYSTDPDSNTTIGGYGCGENSTSPASVNNILRQLAADGKALADIVSGGGTGTQPLDATLTALAAITFAANKGLYATGDDAFSTYDLSSFGRTWGGLADAAAARTTLGAVTITAASLANPGYVKINVSGTDLILQWGTGSIGANTTGSINFPTSFATFAVCLVSGGPTGSSSEGDVHPTAAASTSAQAIVNSAPNTAFYSFFAVGV